MKYWTILEFSKEIGRHKNTVDGWFNDLEKQNIHFVNRNEHNIKIYDELDLDIANFISEKRKGQQFTLQGCYDAIKVVYKDRLRPPVVKEEESKSLTTIEELKDEFATMMNEEMDKRINRLIEQRAAQVLEQRLKLLTAPDPVEEQQKQKDLILVQWRIERSLRGLAIEEWNALPEEQRTKKTGFLGWKRVEDTDKKQQFIQRYMDEHYEAYVELEYGVQEEHIGDPKASND